MTLLKDHMVRGALEMACEDIDLAAREVDYPDFHGFPKNKHALLESLLNRYRDEICYVAGNAILTATERVTAMIEANLEPEVAELAELLAEKLRNATKEDKRIVSAILMEVLL
jgi:hypothetical protein